MLVVREEHKASFYWKILTRAVVDYLLAEYLFYFVDADVEMTAGLFLC